MPATADSFLVAFTDDLLELDLGPLPAAERRATAGWVAERIGGAAAVTRFGISVAGLLIGAAVTVTQRAPYGRLPQERRRAIAARLAATRLPVAGEYVKAVRSLAILHATERAHGARR